MSRYIDDKLAPDLSSYDKLLITTQWHPTEGIAVVTQWLTADVFEDLWGDPVFETQRWADLDRQLLGLCDEVRADRYSWVAPLQHHSYPMVPRPDSGLHRQWKDGIPYLGGPRGGAFEDIREEGWVIPNQTIRVPWVDSRQAVASVVPDWDNQAISHEALVAPVATYRCYSIHGRRVLSYIPEAPRR